MTGLPAGTFDNGANDTELITPGKSFTGTVTVNPPLTSTQFTSILSVVSATMTYVLDGTPLVGYSPQFTMWTFGGFSLVFYESNLVNRVRIDYGGPAMFTGPTSAPVLVLPWEANSGSWSYAAPNGSLIDNGSLTGAIATSAPEPASLGLVGLALIFLAGHKQIHKS